MFRSAEADDNDPLQAVLAIRGDSVIEALADCRRPPAPFRGERAAGGAVRAAVALFDEVGPIVERLRGGGVELTVCGHSTAGAVGALFLELLRPQPARARCVAFGPPPCVDAALRRAGRRRPLLSVVLRDDPCPRKRG